MKQFVYFIQIYSMKWLDKLKFSTTNEHTIYHGLIGLFCVAITLFSLDIPFFWDNVYLVSKMAHYYYENSFASVVLPVELDSGHPPFYAMYVAAIWSIFGKTLAVSHWAVFPFLVILGMAYYHLARHFLPSKALPFAMILLLIEPTLLAQSVLGGVDIALTALYLVALNGIFYRKRGLLAVALVLMSAFSLRGIIAVALLGLTELVVKGRGLGVRGQESGVRSEESGVRQQETVFYQFYSIVRKIAPAYFPSIIFVLIWLLYHFQTNGFLLSNPDSPWAADYGYVDFKGWLKNLVIIDWRLLDFGRITLWGMTIFLLFRWFMNTEYRISNIEYTVSNTESSITNHQSPVTNHQSLIYYILLPLFFFIPFITLRYTPILHRYFLPTFLLFSILFIAVWFVIESKKMKSIVFGVVVLSLLSGHFWVYPDRIAKGWDASLAYLPYFELNNQATQYIERQNIPFEKVGAEFPAVNPRKFTHLTDDLHYFIDKDAYKMTDFKYILQSNVMNDFSDSDLEELQRENGDWRLEKEWRKGQVYLRLYVLALK